MLTIVLHVAVLPCMMWQEWWPDINAVREIATKVKKAKKGREHDDNLKPYIFADLKKFLPTCFNEHVVVNLEETYKGQDAKKRGAWGKKDYRLSFASWLVAWDR